MIAQEKPKEVIIDHSFGQEAKAQNINSLNSPQITGDSVSIKSGSKVLMTVTEETTSGSIKLKDAGAVSTPANKLYNNGGDLYWGNNQLGLANSTDNDWTISGNDIYNSNTGKVIIGTTSITSANLNVGGNASTAIYGEGTNDRGSVGGKFITAGSEGYGVICLATSTSVTGPNYGGYFSSAGNYGRGVYAEATGSTGIGIYATSPHLAGQFDGNVKIDGTLRVSGGETTLEQEGWINPTLQNSWEDYGSGFNPSGYFKDSNGIIHLRGMIRNGATSTVIFTLPAGYRTPYQEVHSTTTFGSSSGRCDILANGEVKMVVGSSSYFSLDGISFRAD